MEAYGVVGLFVSALISSTLLPGGSEVILVLLLSQTDNSPFVLWLAATFGNTLGGLITWGMGRWFITRFPATALNEQKYKKPLNLLRRRGNIVLLLSWLPIIGDPLCFVAGWLKLPFIFSLIFIFIGKATRYAILVVLV